MKRTTIYISICFVSVLLQFSMAAFPALQYPIRLEACKFDMMEFIEKQDNKLILELRNNIDLKELETIKQEFCPEGAGQKNQTK